jgi:hypothetical protein
MSREGDVGRVFARGERARKNEDKVQDDIVGKPKRPIQREADVRSTLKDRRDANKMGHNHQKQSSCHFEAPIYRFLLVRPISTAGQRRYAGLTPMPSF